MCVCAYVPLQLCVWSYVRVLPLMCMPLCVFANNVPVALCKYSLVFDSRLPPLSECHVFDTITPTRTANVQILITPTRTANVQIPFTFVRTIPRENLI